MQFNNNLEVNNNTIKKEKSCFGLTGVKVSNEVNRRLGANKGVKRALTEIDHELLNFCFEQYFVSRKQVYKWLMNKRGLKNYKSAQTTFKRILDISKHDGLLEVQKLRKLNYEDLFLITTQGINFLKDRGFLHDSVTSSDINNENLYHDFQVTNIRLIFESILKEIKWVSERVIRAETHVQVPDAILHIFSPKLSRMAKIAIEIEMTQKSKFRYEKKLKDYQSSSYDLVYYFVGSKKVREAINELSNGITKMAYVCLLDDFKNNAKKAEFVSNKDSFVFGDIVKKMKG